MSHQFTAAATEVDQLNSNELFGVFQVLSSYITGNLVGLALNLLRPRIPGLDDMASAICFELIECLLIPYCAETVSYYLRYILFKLGLGSMNPSEMDMIFSHWPYWVKVLVFW